MSNPGVPPQLSVVVPVHRAEGQIRDCLESLLQQRFADLEVLVVLDAPADQSARIVNEIASLDDRVRVIEQSEHRGVGPSRNHGLDEARGRWVAFVDPTDFVSADFHEALVASASASDADVAMGDHVDWFPDGQTKKNRSSWIFQEPDQAAVTLQDVPRLVENRPMVGDKIWRRTFLQEQGLRFTDAVHGDVVFSLLGLAAARAIARCPDGVHHRRQWIGSTPRHADGHDPLELLDRYREVLAELERRGVGIDLRSRVHTASVWHLRTLAAGGDPDRAFESAAGTYFADHRDLFVGEQASAPDRRFHQVTMRDQPIVTLLEDRATDARKRATKYRKQRKAAARRRNNRVMRSVWYEQACRQPVDEDLAVFASFWFKEPAGNPLAIYRELIRRAPHMKCVWVLGRGVSDDGLDSANWVRVDSRKYFDVMGRAKYFVNNVNFPQWVRSRPGTVQLQTTHGTPLKYMGIDERLAPSSDLAIRPLLRRVSRWDHCLSANAYSSEIWQHCYPADFELLETGYPRNDILHNGSERDRALVRQELGISGDKPVVLYAPTYRQPNKRRESPDVDLVRIADRLKDDVTLVFRSHYFVKRTPGDDSGDLIDASGYPDTGKLLLAADMLITDYSSIQFDYANLGRPIINFVPDADEYHASRGTYFDIREQNAGLVAENEADLFAIFDERRWERPEVAASLQAFCDRFAQFDDGGASERVVRRVFADALRRHEPSGSLTAVT